MKKYFLIIVLLTLIFTLDLSSSSKKSTENEPSYLQLNKGDYNILLEKSELIWIGKKITLKEHSGTLQFKEGTISINADGTIYGNIIIDMTSINNTDMKGKWKRKLEEHLKSDDFFDVGRKIASINLPTLFVMEGGYAIKEIGVNTVNTLKGFENE
mgnify:CR=1 FL=1